MLVDKTVIILYFHKIMIIWYDLKVDEECITGKLK